MKMLRAVEACQSSRRYRREPRTVCERWFSSVPGPTMPNRMFVHAGTSLSASSA